MGSVEVRPPDRLLANRYLLRGLLARGGMADVYRGRDSLLGRDVAIKLLRGDGYDEHVRYEAEVRTLAGLNHPGLVALYDAGSDGNVSFFVMELVEGSTLAAYLRGRRLAPVRTAAVGLPLAEALDHVHGRGVVHRDLKPANVLLGTDNRVRLADFGIARLVDGARLTATGLALGTAAYLAPEQVTGGPVGPPADIYALGLVLLECLTGRREYDGTSVESALARLHRAPSIPPDLPGPWGQLLRDMTSRTADERPSAAAVADRLRPLAAQQEAGPAALPYVPPPRLGATPAPTTPLPVGAPAGSPADLPAGSTADLPLGVGPNRVRRMCRRLLPVALAVPLAAGAIAVVSAVSGSHSADSTSAPPAAVPSPVPQPATEVPRLSSAAPVAPAPRPAVTARVPASTSRRSLPPPAAPAPPAASAAASPAPPAAAAPPTSPLPAAPSASSPSTPASPASPAAPASPASPTTPSDSANPDPSHGASPDGSGTAAPGPGEGGGRPADGD